MATASPTRRLAAIVAADIAGFSRLVAADEEGVLAALHAHRSELIDPKIAAFKGRIANTAGDSLLIEFPSVIEAVRCSLEIQCGMTERNADISESDRIQFRIGINVGDVIDQSGDLLGDGVNVAARLEGLADPGGICLSRAARDQVRDRLQIELQDLGEVSVKNVPRAVRAFKVARGVRDNAEAHSSLPGNRFRQAALWATALLLAVVTATLVWQLQLPKQNNRRVGEVELPRLREDRPSIAVLPFANLSDDRAQEYFSDGISEDIIIELSKVSGLLVVARNSSFAYKNKPTGTHQIARELGVGHILDGSIRKSGNRVRITAQLVEASTGKQIWGERYDRTLTDIFAVQDEVTEKIVSQLAVRLTENESIKLHRKKTVNPDAYDMLLRGVQALRRYSRSTNVEAREYFEKAASIDPSYARAHANIGYIHVLDVFNGYAKDPDQSMMLARKSIETAVRADPNIPQIYLARSSLFRFERQYEKALLDAHKIVELEPNSDQGFVALGLTLNYVGRHEEALKAVKIALRLNPHASVFHYFTQGMALFHLERYADAASALAKSIERNPNFLRGHLLLAAAYGQLGRTEDAEWEAAEAENLLPNLSISQQAKIVPYKIEADIDRYVEGLRKAGVAE